MAKGLACTWLTPSAATPTRLRLPLSCFWSAPHLKFQQHYPRDEQADPQDGGGIEADPEQLVVGAADLGHVL